MKKFVVALVPAAVLAFTPVAVAAGSISTTATTVSSGTSFVVTACVTTSGDGGYLLVKGPNTFSQDLFFGPVNDCGDVTVSTAGWVAGKYRISGYEFTTKGTKGLGSVTVTVS